MSKKRKRAAAVLAACIAALALVLLGVGYAARRHRQAVEEQRLAAAQAEAARLAAEAEAERLAAEAEAEAARLAAEAEAERLAAEEEAARQAALEQARAEAAAAKQGVQYGDQIGTVWIEGTKVNCALYWGDSYAIMDYGAGCSNENGCVLPGENGTVFIGAHTGSFFSDLGSAQVGAIVHLDTPWGDMQYQITETRVIYETDVDQCRWGDTEPNCILYTCYPFGILVHTDRRFLVYAEPLQADENGVIPAAQGD